MRQRARQGFAALASTPSTTSPHLRRGITEPRGSDLQLLLLLLASSWVMICRTQRHTWPQRRSLGTTTAFCEQRMPRRVMAEPPALSRPTHTAMKHGRGLSVLSRAAADRQQMPLHLAVVCSQCQQRCSSGYGAVMDRRCLSLARDRSHQCTHSPAAAGRQIPVHLGVVSARHQTRRHILYDPSIHHHLRRGVAEAARTEGQRRRAAAAG